MKIQIEAELSNYIESLHYDRNSIQELLLMAAKQGLKDTDAYNAWMKDYLGKSVASLFEDHIGYRFVLRKSENTKTRLLLKT